MPADQRTDHLQAALAAGFVVACVGALFLAEQYYPPLWFLPALAASMASSLSTAGRPGAAESKEPKGAKGGKFAKLNKGPAIRVWLGQATARRRHLCRGGNCEAKVVFVAGEATVRLVALVAGEATVQGRRHL